MQKLPKLKEKHDITNLNTKTVFNKETTKTESKKPDTIVCL